MAFYRTVLGELGLVLKFTEDERQWGGWTRPPAARPLLLVGRPYNGYPATPGNGQMVALTAVSRESVDRVYKVALENGATDEGPPGLRPWYHPDYYGAYFRDPDGNKLCICCHEPVVEEGR